MPLGIFNIDHQANRAKVERALSRLHRVTELEKTTHHDPLADLDLEGDARKVPDSPALVTVRKLVDEWDKLERDQKELAAAMYATQERKFQIERESLPGAMAEAGVTSFVADNGRSVVVKQIVNGNIPALTTIEKAKGPERGLLQTRRDQAIAVVKSKWPGLVKTEVTVSLGKGETELATRVAELLRTEFQLEPSVDETIHPATLNSHFTELKDQGRLEDIPVEPFALYVGPIAKIK